MITVLEPIPFKEIPLSIQNKHIENVMKSKGINELQAKERLEKMSFIKKGKRYRAFEKNPR